MGPDVIADPDMGDPEVMPLTSINDRGFTAFSMNPITGFMAEYLSLGTLTQAAKLKSMANVSRFVLH